MFVSRRGFDLFLYEMPEGGGGDPDPIADEPAAVEPEPQPWSLSQEEWQKTMQFLQGISPILEHAARSMQSGEAPAAPVEPSAPSLDPWDDNYSQNVEQYIANQVEQRLAQAFGPYQHVINNVAAEEGEKAAKAEIELIAQEFGQDGKPAEFDPELTMMVASAHMADPNADPALALRAGARFAMDVEARIRADERQRIADEQKRLAQSPSDLSVGGAAAAEGNGEIPTGHDRYERVAETWLNRRAQGVV